MRAARELHHATVITMDGRGALIRGPSGSGKSDLALRCIAPAPGGLLSRPARLIADDQVWLERRGNDLVATSPDTIRGLIEVRGLGVVSVPFEQETTLALVVEIVAPERITRLPDPERDTEVSGTRLPLLEISAFEASAPLKLLLALRRTSEAR